MSVTEFGPVDHEGRTEMVTGDRSRTAAWLPAPLVRYRAVTLVPLAVLAGVAIAGLAGIAGLPGIIDPSVNGSGCCPPVH